GAGGGPGFGLESSGVEQRGHPRRPAESMRGEPPPCCGFAAAAWCRGPMRPQHSSMKLRAMSLTASAHSIPGTFKQRLLIDGRHEVVTDEPVRLGGQGSGPSPHELLPAALPGGIAATIAAYGP